MKQSKKNYICSVLTIILALNYCIDIYGQSNFSKRSLIDGIDNSFASRVVDRSSGLIQEGGIQFIDSMVYGNIAFVRYDDKGAVIFKKIIRTYNAFKARSLLIGDTIYILARSGLQSDSLVFTKTSLYGDDVWSKTLYNPNAGLDAQIIDMVRYGDYFVIALSTGITLFNGNKILSPYIMWLDQNIEIDTIMEIDLPEGQLWSGQIAPNGNLVYYTAEHYVIRDRPMDSFSSGMVGFIEFDQTKRMVKNYKKTLDFHQGIYTYKVTPWVMDNKGSKYVAGEEWGLNRGLQVYAVDSNNKEIWRNNDPYSDEMLEPYGISLCTNGDILHTGEATRRGFMLKPAYIHRIGLDGKTKWIRYYGYSEIKNSDFECKGGYLNCLIENKDLSISAYGSMRNTLNPHQTLPIANDSTWILRVDSLGCLEDNKCNDEYFWDAPNGWVQYDQLTMKHKEWNYTQLNTKTGQSRLVRQRFGQDTTMFDRNTNTISKWARYRTVHSIDDRSAVERTDTLLVSWTKEGKAFGMTIRNCLQCRQQVWLYDFALNVGDQYILPYNYGTATVILADTMALLDGYLRKRIILQHNDSNNQSKYGDLIWIEGIGATNGLLYYQDWVNGTRTELTCYIDRGMKRYTTTSDPDCRKPVLTKPTFDEVLPFCIGSAASDLPIQSLNDNPITGYWLPSTINTAVAGTYKYVFTPDRGQLADTTSIKVVVTDRVLPEFDRFGPYLRGVNPVLLSTSSINNISGSWSPEAISTDEVGDFTYVFTPDEGYCALPLALTVRVLSSIDTTDMDASTIWHSSNYIGNFVDGDCRQVIGNVKVMRDTLIGDRLCRIIGVTSGGTYIKASELPIYLKEGRMSFYEDDAWKQLYDFNAEVGDTITYHVSKNYPYYDKYTIDGPVDSAVISNNPYTYVIDKVGTILTTDGKTRKRYSTTSVGPAFYFSSMIVILEEVGSLNGLFGINYGLPLPDCNRLVGLRCYSDDDTDIKLIDEPCDRLVSVTDLSLGKLRLFPNPGSHYFTISAEASQLPYSYIVSDAVGRTVVRGILTDTSTDVKADAWPLGMYMVTIYDREGYSHTYKWVKQ